MCVGVSVCVCVCVCVCVFVHVFVCDLPTVDSSVVKKLAVTLTRGSEGYGFSVSGFNPISITRVQPGQCQGEDPGAETDQSVSYLCAARALC